MCLSSHLVDGMCVCDISPDLIIFDIEKLRNYSFYLKTCFVPFSRPLGNSLGRHFSPRNLFLLFDLMTKKGRRYFLPKTPVCRCLTLSECCRQFCDYKFLTGQSEDFYKTLQSYVSFYKTRNFEKVTLENRLPFKHYEISNEDLELLISFWCLHCNCLL